MPVSETAAEMQVQKSKKVLALTQGVAIVSVVAGFFIATAVLFFILYSQQEATDKVLECVVPGNACYDEKAAKSQVDQIVNTNSALIVCLRKGAETREEIKACVYEEILDGSN